jgi:hypothetical protein
MPRCPIGCRFRRRSARDLPDLLTRHRLLYQDRPVEMFASPLQRNRRLRRNPATDRILRTTILATLQAVKLSLLRQRPSDSVPEQAGQQQRIRCSRLRQLVRRSHSFTDRPSLQPGRPPSKLEIWAACPISDSPESTLALLDPFPTRL